ncbi:flagellar export protein FliJ [bacterium]|nr:flagellar export protein FliJ [bacterium]
MGFDFRLEKVLRYRQRLVDQQARRVALAQKRVGELTAARTELDRSVAAEMAGHPGAGPLLVKDLQAKTAWLEHLRRKIADVDAGLNEARNELLREQESLNAAWRDLEALQQLRRKQKAAWIHEQETRESKELDEVGQIRADRARRSILAHGTE